MAHTQVSKTQPAIRKILEKTFGPWRGWKVYVDDDPDWSYGFDSYRREPIFIRTSVTNPVATQIVPHRSGPTYVGAPAYGEVVVAKETGGAHMTPRRWDTGSVTIHIPPLDEVQMDVARDALLAGEKKRSPRFRELLSAFGPYADVAADVLEAQAKTLGKAERGKTSKQLDREIADFLRGRAARS